eukprot:1347070-Prorocentrum_lima.AAC.1
MVRINATINSTQTWALEAQQPQLHEVAANAKAKWLEAKVIFDGYKRDVSDYTLAESGRDAR